MNNSFNYKSDGLELIPNFLEGDFLEFIQDYFSIKINSSQYDKNLDLFLYGYRFYSDTLMETVLQNSCEFISKVTGIKLVPTYSMTYMYMKDDVYQNEVDTSSEISALLCLGISNDVADIEIICSDTIKLSPGNLLIYNSRNIKPKMTPISNKWILQTTFNFVDINGPYKDNIYDKRPYLGFNYFHETNNGGN